MTLCRSLVACAVLLASCGSKPKGYIEDFTLERHSGSTARVSITSESEPEVDAVGLYIRSTIEADIAGVPEAEVPAFVEAAVESIRADLASRGFVPEVIHNEREIWFVKYESRPDAGSPSGSIMLRSSGTDKEPWTLTVKLMETP